jgi:hypothetical protein
MGDADGVFNGIIVDPSGIAFDTRNESNPNAGGVNGDSGGGGGGCFITSTAQLTSATDRTAFIRNVSIFSLANVFLLVLLISLRARSRVNQRQPVSVLK